MYNTFGKNLMICTKGKVPKSHIAHLDSMRNSQIKTQQYFALYFQTIDLSLNEIIRFKFYQFIRYGRMRFIEKLLCTEPRTHQSLKSLFAISRKSFDQYLIYIYNNSNARLSQKSKSCHTWDRLKTVFKITVHKC